MIKFLALIMVLCLALTAVPGLAEENFSGTWYLLMMGMTGGTFELKEDGTCTGTSAVGAEEQTAEGTWTSEENVVTLNIEGTSMPLTYDGTSLILGEEALSAFGGGIAPSGMDASALASLICFSREPGPVTAAEFSAYQEDGTLPEGKTKEEMDALQAQLMLTVMSLVGSMNTAGSGETPPAEANPEVTVVESNFYIRKSYGDKQEGYYVAKVQNQNEVPLYISDASMILKDADGKEIGKKEYLGESGSRYLDPGESSFITMEADVEAGAVPDSYEVTLQTTGQTYRSDTQLDVEKTELRITEGYWTNYYLCTTITNSGEAPLSRASAVVAVRSADGQLLDIGTAGLYQNELATGSTITLVDTLDSRTVDYCKENSLEMGEVEAYAWVESSD